MKVAIIAPPYPLEECPAPPLGITYVAAAFETAGAEVRIIDFIVSQYSADKLRNELNAFKPDVVGATSVTMNFSAAANIMKTVKAFDPSIITIMGGPHVTFDAMNTLRGFPEIDLVVMGEGEETIMEMMSRDMDRKQWPKIRGLFFRENGRFVNTGAREWIDDIDSVPLPARHLLSHARYQALGFPISIITSRGCPYSCIFCLGRRMVGRKIRRRKAALVVDEIEDILSYGWTRINVADDLFTSDRERVREICREIQRRGIDFTWSAFARVNTIDKPTLELMKETGCDSVSFGLESGNTAMLERARKGITTEQVRAAVKLCNEVGIIAHGSFIVGLPGETPETLRETSDFANSMNLMYGYHFLAPFPGTTVREEVEQYDLEILTHDWSQYDANSAIVRTSSLSPDEMDRFVASYNEEMNAQWEKIVRGFHEGTNSPEDNLKVEGYFKMPLVFKILSEDIIESCGTFSCDERSLSSNTMIDLLCRKIVEMTGMEKGLVERTITYFVNSGYLEVSRSVGKIAWEWARNRKSKH